MAKRTKTSAARRALIKRLHSKVESLTFELRRAKQHLYEAKLQEEMALELEEPNPQTA